MQRTAKKAGTDAEAAEHDALTGMMNRWPLQRRFKAQAALAD